MSRWDELHYQQQKFNSELLKDLLSIGARLVAAVERLGDRVCTATPVKEIVEQLAKEMHQNSGTSVDWEQSDPGIKSVYRSRAESLVESGWRKGDPA